MSASSTDLLQKGRDALERHAWQEAYEALSEADREGSMPAEGLRQLADAAWWSGRPDETIEVLERAYGAYLEAGDRSSAAMTAFELSRQYGMQMALPMAGRWAAQAQRLASEDPDSPVHGWLTFMTALMTWDRDTVKTLSLYDEALKIAERTGDRNLRAMSLQDKGHLLCLQGKVSEGFALVDEAMVAAVGGELSAETTGYVYCGMIGLCSRLGDYRRAAEWTEATLRWCERRSIPGFPGVCRVHRAELMRIHGAWPRAEEEARRACEELPKFNYLVGLGYAHYEIGEVRRRMGDLSAAEAAYGRAHEYGGNPQPGLSLLRLAQGKLEAAAASVRQALAEATENHCYRVRLLAAQAQVALAAGDLETAASASEELDSIVAEFEATSLQSLAASVRGSLRLAQGDAPQALGDLRRARQGWQEVGAPFEVAEVRVLMAEAFRAMGDEEAAALELKAARATFERLGARPAAESAARLLGELVSAEEAPERVRRGFVFTDIVKSTDLIGVIGDEAWEDLLAWHDLTLRSLFASHGGEVAHHTGDGFFVAFEDAGSALACCIAVQQALAEHRREHGFAPQLRIGVHAAEGIRRGQDYSGAEVHKAARIAGAAQAGEILASEETMAEARGAFVASEPREVTVKGIPKPVRVATIEWRSLGGG